MPFIMAEIVNGVFLYINLRLAIDPVKSSLARELLDCVCTLVPDTFMGEGQAELLYRRKPST
jgi:hypothetical protein